jgi:hypothetical protein
MGSSDLYTVLKCPVTKKDHYPLPNIVEILDNRLIQPDSSSDQEINLMDALSVSIKLTGPPTLVYEEAKSDHVHQHQL